MADATNGYILEQQIYTGKNCEQRTAEVGLGTRVVLDLTQGHENQVYIVVTDNFYTSPTLTQKLLQGNTRGLPKELVFSKKKKENETGELAPGEPVVECLLYPGMITNQYIVSVQFISLWMPQKHNRLSKKSKEEASKE